MLLNVTSYEQREILALQVIQLKKQLHSQEARSVYILLLFYWMTCRSLMQMQLHVVII